MLVLKSILVVRQGSIFKNLSCKAIRMTDTKASKFVTRRGKIMKKAKWIFYAGMIIGLNLAVVFIAMAAYHHMGEMDSPNFLSAYPDKAGTKLDNCALCHRGGTYVSGGKPTTLGSCQWCHYKYGYDASGNIDDTLNQYGKDYRDHGRNTAAFGAIDFMDSDGDGYPNKAEVDATTYPGDGNDDPSKIPAPAAVYTKAQLEAMPQHTQFMLMNVTKSSGGDSYVEYSGVTIEELLNRADMLSSATGIRVYAPDGFSWTHPLLPPATPDLKKPQYHVIGTYPSSLFYYNAEADMALNPTYGWCDYSAPSCVGRSHDDPIVVQDGLRLLLGIKRDGVYLTPGVLTFDNKLDGEGPYRVVPPQVNPGFPDQASTSAYQGVIWPYDSNADHNAGAATRSTTIIKVDPLPSGTTDINILEAGWTYIDQAKLVVYGALAGSDSNGNGIPDSEEGIDPAADVDKDGIPDFQDPDTATLKSVNGSDFIGIHCSQGDLANVSAESAQLMKFPWSRPNDLPYSFAYGATKFDIAGLRAEQTVNVTLSFPKPIPKNSIYFIISNNGTQRQILFGSNDRDDMLTLTLTDGDRFVDLDGAANGIISFRGALAVPVPLPAALHVSFETEKFGQNLVYDEQIVILSAPYEIAGPAGLKLEIPGLSGFDFKLCQAPATGEFTIKGFMPSYGIPAQTGRFEIDVTPCTWGSGLPIAGKFYFNAGPFIGPATFKGKVWSKFDGYFIDGIIEAKSEVP
jgi:hypothetical protein